MGCEQSSIPVTEEEALAYLRECTTLHITEVNWKKMEKIFKKFYTHPESHRYRNVMTHFFTHFDFTMFKDSNYKYFQNTLLQAIEKHA